MRYFAMVLVALATAAVADVDPAVMAMLREWSLASPNPNRGHLGAISVGSRSGVCLE
jgi:hypothetical protein